MMEAGARKLTQADLDALTKLTVQLEEKSKKAQAWIIASLGNYPLPISFYEPWACYQTLYLAETAGTLTTIERKNGKLLLTPANFFAWLDSLPAQQRRKGAPRKAKEGAS